MAVWSPLTTHWAVNMQDCSSRGGAKIDTIIHHHAASSNKLATLALFAPGGREVTPNYFIAGREIWGIVPEDYRAWTSGSYEDDRRAITYEILNSANGPNWPFDPVALETVARLDADIARRYGVPLRHSQPGFMEHRNIYEWFRRGYATACAGPSFNIGQIIAKVEAMLAPKPEPKPEPEQTPTLGEIMAFKSIGIGYRPNEKEDRLYTTGFDFEDGQKLSETIMDKSYGTSFYGKITEGGFLTISKGHYEKLVAEFDGIVKTKRAHELAVARAQGGNG